MSYMFYKCRSLRKLNLETIKTKKVEDMSYMFNKCFGLRESNLNNFRLGKKYYLKYIFFDCSENMEIIIKNNIYNIDNFRF